MCGVEWESDQSEFELYIHTYACIQSIIYTYCIAITYGCIMLCICRSRYLLPLSVLCIELMSFAARVYTDLQQQYEDEIQWQWPRVEFLVNFNPLRAKNWLCVQKCKFFPTFTTEYFWAIYDMHTAIATKSECVCKMTCILCRCTLKIFKSWTGLYNCCVCWWVSKVIQALYSHALTQEWLEI